MATCRQPPVTPSSQKHRRRRGHVLAMLGWALVWLAGTAAVAGYSVTRHAPALERVMLDDVQDAIAPIGETPIMVSVTDHVATLSGSVDDAGQRDALLIAASGGLGIRRVVDRLVVREPDPATGSETRPETRPDPAAGPASLETRVERLAEELAAKDAAMPAEPASEGPSPDELAPDDDVLADAGADEPVPEDGADAETAPSDAPIGNAAATGDDVEGAVTEPDVSAPVDVAGEELPPQELFELGAEEEDLAGLPSEEPPFEDVLSPDMPGRDTGDSAEAPPEDTPETDAAPVGRPQASPPEAVADESFPSSGPALVRAPAEPSALSSPTLRLALSDRVLTIEGALARSDDAAALILKAMDSFELDYVSNTLENGEDIAPADWLEPIAALLPALSGLDDPGVDVAGRQVTLHGTAPDAATRETIVVAALASLGDHSLVERIDIATGDPVADSSTGIATDVPVTGDESAENGTSADGPDTTTPIGTASLDASLAAGAPAEAREPAITSAAALRAALAARADERILFRSGSARLPSASLRIVDGIAELLLAHPLVFVAIEGHTDGFGLRETNLNLSQRRANAVRDRLVSRGVPRERLAAYGYGEGVPVADNATPEGRAANRRIEFTF